MTLLKLCASHNVIEHYDFPTFSCIILGVRSLANASRARQFNPLNDQNPPGVG